MRTFAITLSDFGTKNLDELCRKLAESGFVVTAIFPSTGVVVGKCHDADKLRKIKGILSVEAERA